jgi:sugar phosphate isomerase/epimerase
VKKGANMITLLSERASKLNCKIGLYNHGDWFGEPENQIKIIEALPHHDLGLIYNFHHAHKQIDRFPEMVEIMLPHLWSVNLNGLRKGGPKILTFGKGDHEIEMVNLLLKQGYKGDFGILGHVEDADVNTILEANLKGLKLNN